MPYPMTAATRATPNQGGSINFRGRTINYAPSEGQDRDPMRGGSGGTMVRNGAVTRVPPSPSTRPYPYAKPSPASQEFLRTGIDPEVTLPPRPAASPVSPVSRAPIPNNATPNFDGLSGFGLENAMANAGIYQPGSFGAQNAATNGTGYRPPQQTERANPLTGDNNFPLEGQTTAVARAPFIQRGTSLPAGRDAMPAAIRTTETEDGDIGRTMQGIQSRIAGSQTNPFARRFGEPSKQNAYNSMLKRVMG